MRVTALKVDPYINVDAGTMNPTEHGEVFVLNDGDETDQDMGNYERFLGTELSSDNYMTTGRVYRTVIENERNMVYKGKCVQVVPHIPLEVIRRINSAVKKANAEIAVIEIGGTVGEYENILFIEAIRMLKLQHPDDVITVMVSYVPVPNKIGEMKTKPTQHAVRTLNTTGVHPDFIIARSECALDKKRKEKIALFCNVPQERVVSAPDVDSIYRVPVNFEKHHISDHILELLNMKPRTESKLGPWKALANKATSVTDEVNIAIVGKYFDTGDFVLSDAYISVIESIKYSAYKLGVKPKLHWVNSKDFENGARAKDFKKYDGLLVPGGFGETGIEGKINAIEYARKNKVPYFGLCYGMQLLVIEYARHVLKLPGAHTVEINPDTTHPIIDIMPEQKKLMEESNYGGTMRLGSYPAVLTKGTRAAKLYGKEKIEERHRHRYEVNPEYIRQLEEAGLVFSGRSPDGTLMEIAELPKSKHPFFMGTQFHPEFTARPFDPHPLFTGFVKAAKERRASK
jgi:CTP synthase